MILALVAGIAFAGAPILPLPTQTQTPSPVPTAAQVPDERIIPSQMQTQLVVLFTQFDASRTTWNNAYVRALEAMKLDLTRNDKGDPCWQWDMGRGVFVQTCPTPVPSPSPKKK